MLSEANVDTNMVEHKRKTHLFNHFIFSEEQPELFALR